MPRLPAAYLSHALAFVALLLFLCAAGAWAQSSAGRAMDILERAIRSEGRVAYAGTVEIRRYGGPRPPAPQVQRLTAASGNRQRVEVVAPPDQSGKLIVSNGRVEWEFRPRAGTARRRELLPPEEIQRHKLEALRLVRDTLHPVHLGTESVAGRTCHVIGVRPPDGRETRKKVWIDTEHFVELRWARYSAGGRPLSTWSMTAVDFSPQVDASAFEFSPPPGVRVQSVPRALRMTLAEAERRLGFKALIPGYLPAGYALHSNHVGIAEFRGRRAMWLQFINGVDTFSIFQSPALRAALPAQDRALHWSTGGSSFLLVGDLPTEEQHKIRDSMR